ncbi:MAG TPA: hypothetical protein VFG10_03870 [Saprospiraceae bacterium]|nr:hypothetical protein [Saprospiraceae bacterium]
MYIKTFLITILFGTSLIGSCQVKEEKAERVVEYDRFPERKYEAIVEEEYQSTNSLRYDLLMSLIKECGSLTTTDRYKEMDLSIKRMDCEGHQRACDHVLNLMNLIIEWILEKNETSTEAEAIHKVLIEGKKKRLIELTLNDHLIKYQNIEGLKSAARSRKTDVFIKEITNTGILLTDSIGTATLREVKNFTYTIKDWVVENEIVALKMVMYK